MDSLRTFLKTHLTSDKLLTNFISLLGGKFNIPSDKKETFYALYSKAAPFFTETDYIPLVYKTPPINCQPLMIDVDLRTVKNPAVDIISHSKFAQCLAAEIVRITKSEGVSYFIVTKDSPYQKKFKGETCFASGAHIYFPHIRIPLSLANHMLVFGVSKCLSFYQQFQPINEPCDIVDSRIPKRSNGLCLLASFKAPKTGGRYTVQLIGNVFANGTVEEQLMETTDFFDNLPQIMASVYSFLWEEGSLEENNPILPPIKKIPVTVKHITAPVSQKEPFNLLEFLQCTKTHTPSHDEWLQIIVYCSTIKMSRTDTCELLNKFFSPDDLQENYRVYDAVIPGDSSVSRGSMVRYLQKYGCDIEWDTIFPEQTFVYYGEYEQFMYNTGLVWHRKIVEKYLGDTISFVKNVGKCVYRDTVLKQDKFGNTFRQVSTFIQDSEPFLKDGLVVNIQYSLKMLKEVLLKSIKKKPPSEESQLEFYLAKKKLVREVSSGDYTNHQNILKIRELLQLDNQEIPMNKIYKELFSKGYIKRYDNMKFLPYLFKNPCIRSCYNTFQGFHLLSYQARVVRDWKKTAIYDFLWEVYACKTPEKMEGILNVFAWKIQNPFKRSEKLTALMSTEHGSGKTSLFKLWCATIGEEFCAFYNNFTEFSSEFNMGQVNRLIIFVDDIHDLSARQQQVLNARVTCETMRFNQKNEKPFWHSVCDEIYFTM